MKRLLYIFVFLAGLGLSAQTALQHYGNMQLHPGAQVGMHTSFVNEAPFEPPSGLFGFYGDNPIFVSGSFSPTLFDTEIFHLDGVDLLIPISVANNISFIDGDFRTDKSLTDLYITQLQGAMAMGANNDSKMDGYYVAINESSIVFPVGDFIQHRPLTLEGEVFPFAKCAYFRDDPENPTTFPPFRTDLKPRTIDQISDREFWRLEGSSSGRVTVTWNISSNLAGIAGDLSEVVLVGWNKSARRWLELGTEAVSGDLTNGFIQSAPIVPDQWEIITFGSLAVAEELMTLDNFYLSPNGDGANDRLVIEELQLSPNNRVQIFDRNGIKVFDQVNYTDEFDGVSNVDGFIFNREAGLPEGVYFYLVDMLDLDLHYQGFLYLQR